MLIQILVPRMYKGLKCFIYNTCLFTSLQIILAKLSWLIPMNTVIRRGKSRRKRKNFEL